MPISLFKNNQLIETLQPPRPLWKQKFTRHATGHTLHMNNLQAPASTVDACIALIEQNIGAQYNIHLQPAAASSAPAFASTVPLKVVTYTPHLSHLTDKPSSPNRYTALSNALHTTDDADVFMVPEYYFNFTNGNPATKVTPFTLEELDTLLDRLRTASRLAPKTLFIPGTIIWKGEDNFCRNSAFVFLNGDRVHSDDKRIRYDKAAIDYERAFMKGPNWAGGSVPRYDFSFKGMNCRLEICKDSGSESNASIDLQLIVASGLALAARAETQAGGWCVHADGDGFSVRQQVRRQNHHQESTVLATHSIEVGVPQR